MRILIILTISVKIIIKVEIIKIIISVKNKVWTKVKILVIKMKV